MIHNYRSELLHENKLNFILGSIFSFLCFVLLIIHHLTKKKQRKIKIEPRIKLNHNIYSNQKGLNQITQPYQNVSAAGNFAAFNRLFAIYFTLGSTGSPLAGMGICHLLPITFATLPTATKHFDTHRAAYCYVI